MVAQKAEGRRGSRILLSLTRRSGSFVEAHALDAKTAKKIPKRMTGLTLAEAAAAARPAERNDSDLRHVSQSRQSQ